MSPRPASRPVVPLQEPVPPNMTPTLHFSRAEFAARVDRTRRAMEKRGIDALIVSDPSNMAWLTGYDGWSFYVHQAVVLPIDDVPVWFGRSQDANGAHRTTWMARERDRQSTRLNSSH